MVEIEGLTEEESQPGLIWVRLAAASSGVVLAAGQTVFVVLDGDPMEFQATVLDGTKTGRVLLLLDRTANTQQVELGTEGQKSFIGRPLVDPNAA